MSEAPVFVYAYDLSCDRERREVDQLLQGYGFRRQKSVFECRLTKAQQATLQRALTSMSLQSGFLVVYRIAPNCVPDTIGDPPHFPDDDWAWVV